MTKIKVDLTKNAQERANVSGLDAVFNGTDNNDNNKDNVNNDVNDNITNNDSSKNTSIRKGNGKSEKKNNDTIKKENENIVNGNDTSINIGVVGNTFTVNVDVKKNLKYTETRKLRSYYIPNDLLNEFDEITTKYNLDKSETVVNGMRIMVNSIKEQIKQQRGK
jgi:hypothetical protein